jgi:type VI secretion system protein ImpF
MQPLIPSVLDRLIDASPTVTRETPKTRTQVLRDLKMSVRRDLENLLNTRWRCVSWPPNLDELDVSLVNYGIPDWTGTNLGVAAAQEEFRRVLEGVIRRYEPRLKNVRVALLDGSGANRTLMFRIDAVLQAEPAPEPVSFQSALEPSSGAIEIKGEAR